VIDPSEDGVTHINIYSKGRTELGRLLSNFAHTPTDTVDGRFESLEGYWYWLLIGDGTEREELKKLHGFAAKKRGKELAKRDYTYEYGEQIKFKEKFEAALFRKIEQHGELNRLFYESTLPFKHYYVYPNKIVEPYESQWILDYLEELR
jgi:hypothetical protein